MVGPQTGRSPTVTVVGIQVERAALMEVVIPVEQAVPLEVVIQVERTVPLEVVIPIRVSFRVNTALTSMAH